MNFGVGILADSAADKTPATGYATTVASSVTSVPATTWTRITATGVVPIGTKTVRIDVWAPTPTLSQPFYFTGVQLEEGSSATAFRRSQNTVQGELAACQRYYFIGFAHWSGLAQGSGYITGYAPFPVPMRVAPTIGVLANGTGRYHSSYGGALNSISPVNFSATTPYTMGFHFDTNLAANAYTVGSSTTDIQYSASAEL
jgi:hypothetical protein